MKNACCYHSYVVFFAFYRDRTANPETNTLAVDDSQVNCVRTLCACFLERCLI